MRVVLSVGLGLFVTFSTVGCGDGDGGCPEGTILVANECVLNTGGGGGGGGFTAIGGDCTADDPGDLDVGAACTKSCQCRSDLPGDPLICYAGPYHQGFSFCTKQSDNSLSSNDGYVSMVFPSECDLSPTGARIYMKTCESLSDCAALSDLYTHCGTSGLPWASPTNRQTECPRVGKDGGQTITLNNTCVIATLPPFSSQ